MSLTYFFNADFDGDELNIYLPVIRGYPFQTNWEMPKQAIQQKMGRARRLPMHTPDVNTRYLGTTIGTSHQHTTSLPLMEERLCKIY